MITDISASEVGSILGLNPYATPMDVWLKKSGVVVDNSSDATRRGQMLESAIIDRWHMEHINGLAQPLWLRRGPALNEDPIRRAVLGQGWVVARPDAVAGDYLDGRYVALMVMDAKSCRAFDRDAGWGAEGSTEIPEQYAAQLLWQCAAVGVERGDLAAFATLSDGWRVYHLVIPDAHQRAVIAAVADWRERHLLGEVPPPIDGGEAWSEHLRAKFKGRKGERREATSEDRALLRDLHRVRQQIVTLKTEAKVLEQHIQSRMGDATELVDGEETLATWRTQSGSRRVDGKALRKAHPEIAEQFTTQGEESRRLKLMDEEGEE